MNKLKDLSGIGKVFSFSVHMTTSSKGWRSITIGLALLLFLIPLGVMVGTQLFSDSEEIPYGGTISAVYYIDETDGEWSPDALSAFDGRFSDITYESAADYNEALTIASESDCAVVLCVSLTEQEYLADIVIPDGSSVTEEDVDRFTDFLGSVFPNILMQKSGMEAEQLAYSVMPITVNVIGGAADDIVSEEPAEESSIGEEILRFTLPYVTVMFMYFFVLFYGQSAAQSIVMEKTSKLMDTILVSVKPAAMIFGKITATVVCAFIQLAIWLISLLLGLAAGEYAIKLIDPDSVGIFGLIRDSGIFEGMFSPVSVILSLAIVISGCLLYCSLASIGGALAGKQEDLQSTNVLFTMVLVVSFMVVLFGGDLMTEGSVAAQPWMHWIPFTAVLTTPSSVLMGDVSVLAGIASLALTLVFCALIMLLAGKMYKMMSFYKGNPPKLMQVLSKFIR